MDRKIVVEVNGSYLRKDNKIAGVQGEGNSTYLNLIFDEGWSGLAKKITFWNAKGMNPVERTLTADHLTNMSTSLLDYTVPIPPEPLEFDGEMEYVIDGYKDGVRVRSLADKMVVKYAPVANNAGTPTDPTPTQAEQLQEQIDTMLSDMQAERIKAETAASTSQSAAETSLEAKGSAESAAQTAITKAGEASDSADAAKISEENAKQSETNAKASEESAASNAQTATNKASEAVQASEEAISAKNAAATSEENAKTSETKAKQSETNAKSSEETAVAAKDEAVAAKNSAETAKTDAEQAKEDAIAAKTAAETARDQAQEIAGGDYATKTELTQGLSTKLSASDIINNLTSGGTSVPLSAEQGKVLKGLIDKLNGDSSEVGSVAYQIAQIVAGADARFDTLKEIADWIISDTTGAAKMASDILALQNEMSSHVTNADIHVTADEKTAWNEKDVFIATYGTTTSADIEAAYQAGKAVYCKYGTGIFGNILRNSSFSHSFFGFLKNSKAVYILCANDAWSVEPYYLAPADHASTHASGGSDPITPESIGAAPSYTYGTEDLTAGTSSLETGKLYFVYE